MALTAHITAKIWRLTAEWLCEISHECHLRPETYFTALDILHAALAAAPSTYRVDGLFAFSKLQCLAGTSCAIACKYHEVEVINVGELVILCDRAYPPQDFTQMERAVYEWLDFSPPFRAYQGLIHAINDPEDFYRLMAIATCVEMRDIPIMEWPNLLIDPPEWVEKYHADYTTLTPGVVKVFKKESIVW